MNKRTAILVMLVTYLALMLIDLGMTLRLGKTLIKYLEANPLYSYIGIIGIVAINILIIAVVYWLYRRSDSPTTRFYFVNLLVTICTTRMLVIYNNFQVLLDPPTIQQAMQITQVVKTAAIMKFAWLGFLPYLVGIITYWIWSLDHKVEIKKSEGNEK